MDAFLVNLPLAGGGPALPRTPAAAVDSPVSGRAWWGALIAAWALLCIPLLLVDVPPMADYPNHMARMDVMAQIKNVPFLAEVFAAHWALIPDLAIDSFMPWVVSVIPVYVAGRLLLALIMLLNVAGVAACASVMHGRRTWWSLGAGLAVYNLAFLMGFLNFDLTLAAGMLLAAAWMRVRDRGHAALAALFGAGISSFLFCGHLMGLFFCVVLMGSFEASLLWERLQRHRFTLRHVSLSLLSCWPVVAAAVPLAVLYPLSMLHGSTGDPNWLPWSGRLTQGVSSFINYSWPLDAATGLILIGFLALCALSGRLRVAPGAVVALVVIGGMYPFMPSDIKGTSYVAVRLAVMLGFLAFMAFRPMLGRRTGLAAGLAIAGLFAVRMGVVATAWSGYQTDVTNLRAVLSHVHMGDRVVELDVSPDDVADYHGRAPTAWSLSSGDTVEYHLMSMVVTERRAFWPNLFANPEQQPFILNPAWQELADSTYDVPYYPDLVLRRSYGNKPAPNPFCAFDYLVIQGMWAEAHPETLSPDWLELVETNRTAAIYHIRGGRICALTPKLVFPRASYEAP